MTWPGKRASRRFPIVGGPGHGRMEQGSEGGWLRGCCMCLGRRWWGPNVEERKKAGINLPGPSEHSGRAGWILDSLHDMLLSDGGRETHRVLLCAFRRENTHQSIPERVKWEFHGWLSLPIWTVALVASAAFLIVRVNLRQRACWSGPSGDRAQASGTPCAEVVLPSFQTCRCHEDYRGEGRTSQYQLCVRITWGKSLKQHFLNKRRVYSRRWIKTWGIWQGEGKLAVVIRTKNGFLGESLCSLYPTCPPASLRAPGVDSCERAESVSAHFPRNPGSFLLFPLKGLGYLEKPYLL